MQAHRGRWISQRQHLSALKDPRPHIDGISEPVLGLAWHRRMRFQSGLSATIHAALATYRTRLWRVRFSTTLPIVLIQGKGNRIRIGSRQRDRDPRTQMGARARQRYIHSSWGRLRLRWNYFGLLNRPRRRIGCNTARQGFRRK